MLPYGRWHNQGPAGEKAGLDRGLGEGVEYMTCRGARAHWEEAGLAERALDAA